MPCVLGPSQHTNEEYHEERDAHSGADPPYCEDLDELEKLASSPTKTPSPSIVEYGERAAKVLRNYTQSLRFDPKSESNGIEDEYSDGREPNKYAKEVEQ
jgi:hypothetical protein